MKRTVGYALKATIVGSKPAIWRALQVPARLTLPQLHLVMQASFGWNDSHLHEFEVGSIRFGSREDDDWMEGPKSVDECDVCLDELGLRVGSKVKYSYDFGDEWSVLIQVTALLEVETKVVFIDGERAGPPDDCGGIHRYNQTVRALAKGQQTDDVEWIGADWNPVGLDPDGINRKLRRVR